MPVEFKHKQPFFELVNPVLSFAINKPPVLPANRTFALERRIQIVNFPNKFSKNPKDGELQADNRLENPEYTKPIINGLLLLVLRAIKDMIQRGYIWQEGVAETLKEAIIKGSHKELFFTENIEFDAESEISSQELHNAYVKWCLEEGVAQEIQYKNGNVGVKWLDETYDKACKTAHALSKWVKQRFKKETEHKNVNDSQGKRLKGFKGIKLKKVDDEVFNSSPLNNAELSQNNALNTCTDEKQNVFKRNIARQDNVQKDNLDFLFKPVKEPD